MDRRHFIATSAGLLVAGSLAQPGARAAGGAAATSASASSASPLPPPKKGPVRVAVAIAKGATVIDFCGPWEVFWDVMLPGSRTMPFELYTVAETREPVRAQGGLHIIPDFSVNDAPEPHVIVVPALRADDTLRAWIKAASAGADLTMSVCTGAFQLARVGLLDGLTATTHHEFYDEFAKDFPKVTLVRDVRYVEHERIATAGGLTSGIDLALRVVQRYYGTDVAKRTAEYMEHQSTRWLDPA